MARSTLPTLAHTGWCIGLLTGSSGTNRSHIRTAVHADRASMDPLGFEPRASSLQRRHSTTELWALLPTFGRVDEPRQLLSVRTARRDRVECDVLLVGQAMCLIPFVRR